jgi:hypothetical protein
MTPDLPLEIDNTSRDTSVISEENCANVCSCSDGKGALVLLPGVDVEETHDCEDVCCVQ